MTTELLADEIRDAARSVLEDHATSSRVRALFDDPDRLDRTLWSQMADLGWMGMEIPEAHGGLGARFDGVTVLLEELGRRTSGGPFLATTLAAGAILVAGADHHRAGWLPRLASGEAFGTIVIADEQGAFPSRVRLRRDGATVRLRGSAGFVPDASVADVVVVAARDEAGSDVLAVLSPDRAGVTIERTPVLDQTRNLTRVAFDDCEVAAEEMMIEGPAATSALVVLRNRASVAVAADSVGNAREVVQRTAGYARERTQFGLPIGAFQGVKHQCADMFVGTEVAATLVAAAAEALSTNGRDADRLTSMAKFTACRNGSEVAGRGVQLHGGIGYTWEHDMHIFLKRATLNAALFGDRRFHLRQVADAIGKVGTDHGST